MSREDLKQIPTPPMTETWTPIPHAQLLDQLQGQLEYRGMQIAKEEYGVMRGGHLLFGVLDLNWRKTNEYAAAMGIRTSNDKSFALQIAIGMRVFICDNLAFAGDLIALKRKHTGNLDLEWELYRAVSRYEQRYPRLVDTVHTMMSETMSEGQGDVMMFKVFRANLLPIRLFHPIVLAWETAEEKTTWALYNCFTSHLKGLPPARQFQTTLKLSQFFGVN